jgi:hypothetical protein
VCWSGIGGERGLLGLLVVPLGFGVLAAGLGEHAQAVMAPGDPPAVPGGLEDPQRLGVRALGPRVILLDLSYLAKAVQQARPPDRVLRQPAKHVAGQRGLAAQVTPRVQLRADDVGQVAGLGELTRLQ